MTFVDLGDFPVDGSAVAAFPDAVARRYTALGIAFENDRIVVAMADPANVVALDDIRSITGRDVKPVVGYPRRHPRRDQPLPPGRLRPG